MAPMAEVIIVGQEARILEILGDGRWHSGNEFLREFMPRYSAVIHTLRHKRGYGIEGRRIQGSAVFEFRITSYPAKVRRGEQLSWLE